MPECDCIRPTTPDGIYHETTCAVRLAGTDYMAEAARYSAADNIELLQGMAIVMHGVKTSDECDERLLSLELIEPVGNDGDMRLTEKGAKTLSAWRKFIDDFGKSA